jgi:hypothetical protein
MLHPVYKCDDYDFNGSVLTLYNAELVAQIRTVTEWRVLEEYVGMYDAMVCPDMFKDKDGQTADIILFK